MPNRKIKTTKWRKMKFNNRRIREVSKNDRSYL